MASIFHIHEDGKKMNRKKEILAVGAPEGFKQTRKTMRKHGLEERTNNDSRQDVKRLKVWPKTDKTTTGGPLQPIVKTVTIKEPQVEKFEGTRGEDKKVQEEIDEDDLPLKAPSKLTIFVEKEKELFPESLLNSTEYGTEIDRYLYELEQSYPRARSNFMAKQMDLTWQMRSILVDWLVTVAKEYSLESQTLHLSVNYIDRFLSEISVVRTKFQLVGAAAMLIAGKVEEIYTIEPKDWPALTGGSYSIRQVLKMEQLLLKVLQFRMHSPTIYTFIEKWSAEFKLDPKTMHLAMYFSELVLLEGDNYLKHLPSELAAAAIALARHTLAKQKPWPTKLKETSGYSLKHLSPVVQRQQISFEKSPLRKEQAIQTKYKSPEFNKVALLKPRSLKFLNFDDEP